MHWCSNERLLKNCKCCRVIIRNDSSRTWFFQENLNINSSPWYEIVERYLPRRQGFDLHVLYLGIFSLMGTGRILKETVHFWLQYTRKWISSFRQEIAIHLVFWQSTTSNDQIKFLPFFSFLVLFPFFSSPVGFIEDGLNHNNSYSGC